MKKKILRIAAVLLALILVFCVVFSGMKYHHPLFYLREPFVKEVVYINGFRNFVLEEDEKEAVLASLRTLNRGEEADWSDRAFLEGGSPIFLAIRMIGGKTVFFDLYEPKLFAIDRSLYHLSGEDRENDRFEAIEEIAQKYWLKILSNEE